MTRKQAWKFAWALAFGVGLTAMFTGFTLAGQGDDKGANICLAVFLFCAVAVFGIGFHKRREWKWEWDATEDDDDDFWR